MKLQLIMYFSVYTEEHRIKNNIIIIGMSSKLHVLLLHFVQLSYNRTSGWSCIYVLGCALSNQVHHPTVLDGLEETFTDVNVREPSCACLNQEDTKTKNVHFGRLLRWKLHLRGGGGGGA